MMKFRLLFLCGLLLSSIAWSQDAVIKGEVRNYPLWNIYAFLNEDPLSNQRALLGKVTTDSKGTFEITLKVDETRPVVLQLAGMEGTLYVSPGGRYHVTLPDTLSKDTWKKFDRTEIEWIMQGAAEDELNICIRSFNEDYALFVRDHYYDFATDNYRGSSMYTTKQGAKTKVDMYKTGKASTDTTKKADAPVFGSLVLQFEKAMHDRYALCEKQEYFAQYLRYSIAELKLAAGVSKKELYAEYIMSQPMLLNNPGYTGFLDTFYHDIFTTAKTEVQQNILRAVNAESNYSLVEKNLTPDSLLMHQRVRRYVALKGLKEAWFSAGYNKMAVQRTLQNAAATLDDAQLKAIAGRMNAALQRGKAGNEVEGFTLLDAKKNRWNLDEQQGKYIYLFLFSDWCTACKKDLQYLERYATDFNKEVQFIGINMDEDYATFEQFLRTQPKSKITYLSGQGDPLLRQKLNVRALPYAIMIDPEGKVVYDYTRRPSEGLNLDLEKIRKLMTEPKGGAKTWKEKQ